MTYILILQLLSGHGFALSGPLPRDVCLLQSLVVEKAAARDALVDKHGKPVEFEFAFCRQVSAAEQES